ncbi:protein rIIB [Brevundimonas phage vB_BpoS-Kikimora]|uniref:Protein rIIB n=1 Tax=Brevundimonas phage vB_BpoS-Kikimora TaxID=2948601 RepID=A0A9E7MST6_9CAUD|nr:protein rIIB [Brevundimonas phage vB_BpoS-Kikimora]
MTQPPSKLRLASMISADRVSILLNGQWRGFHRHSQQGAALAELLRQDPQPIDQIAQLADVITWVAKQSNGRVTVDEQDRLYLDKKPIDYGLSGRVALLIEQGMSFNALARFIENVAENPDKSVAEDLYRFLEKGSMPIDEDGYFFVFKKVDEGYRSYASGVEQVRVTLANGEVVVEKGRILYPVGGVVEMNREDCDPNRQQTCSRGLHGCSPKYLNFWYRQSGRVLVGRVNPAHVTSIPADHDDQKLRCCRMEVLAEIDEAEAAAHFPTAVEARYAPTYPSWNLSDAGRLAGGPPLDEKGRKLGWVNLAEIDAAPNMVWAALEPEAVQDDEGHFEKVDGPLVFVKMADEEEDEAPFDPRRCGYDEGFTFGRQDKANGYDADSSILREPGNLTADQLLAYRDGYSEGYVRGYGEPADDIYADGDGEGRWTLARALQVGRENGEAEGISDHSDGIYYNNSWDRADPRSNLHDWLVNFTGSVEAADVHAFASAYDRAYRTAYHTAWYAQEDGAA